MSTTTISKKHAIPSAGSGGVNFLRVLNSESIKFRTLMSTKLLLVLTFVAIVGVGVLSALVRWNYINQMVEVGRQGHKESADSTSTICRTPD
jgi:ABC-2 type transport system permease protein